MLHYQVKQGGSCFSDFVAKPAQPMTGRRVRTFDFLSIRTKPPLLRPEVLVNGPLARAKDVNPCMYGQESTGEERASGGHSKHPCRTCAGWFDAFLCEQRWPGQADGDDDDDDDDDDFVLREQSLSADRLLGVHYLDVLLPPSRRRLLD